MKHLAHIIYIYINIMTSVTVDQKLIYFLNEVHVIYEIKPDSVINIIMYK